MSIIGQMYREQDAKFDAELITDLKNKKKTKAPILQITVANWNSVISKYSVQSQMAIKRKLEIHSINQQDTSEKNRPTWLSKVYR